MLTQMHPCTAHGQVVPQLYVLSYKLWTLPSIQVEVEVEASWPGWNPEAVATVPTPTPTPNERFQNSAQINLIMVD